MKKNLFVVFCICLVLILSVNMTGLAKDVVVLRFGDSYPIEHPTNVAMKRMAEIVSEKSGGNLRIELYPSSQLGNEKDMTEGTIMGTQDMILLGTGGISQYSPRLGIGECPYIWRDIDHMNKVMEGPIGELLTDELLKGRGLRVLTTFYYGKRHVTSNKPIRSVADMRGFKLRTPPNQPIMEMAKAWGAKPTPMDIQELYFALRQNVVDGQENPLPTIDGFKFYEAQKYLVLTGHILTPLVLIINERVWKSLTPEYQEIMKEAVIEARELNNRLTQEQEAVLLEKFKKSGMKVITVDVEEFRKAASGVPKKLENVWGEGLYDKIANTK